MENHPIPQDVTGFKFKLIGSVTIKQFLYLLGFGILTTVVFIMPINIFLKIPMMSLFALFGVGLAFVPIEGRPMDIMLANFAKAIPSENRYIYRKRGANLASFQAFSISAKTPAQTPSAAKTASPHDEKRAMLLSRLSSPVFRPDDSDLARLKNVKSIFEEKQDVIFAKPKQTEVVKPAHAPVMVRLVENQTAPAKSVHVETQPTTPPPAPPVRANPTLAGGFPTIPDVPNVVLGIVRDARGKTLPNVLVEVVDLNGTPVRAFKTNALGQFISATALQNGTYKVHFEDPTKTHEFEDKQISMNGEIFKPLEVVSTDAREKLRQELFGGANYGQT